MEQKNDNKYILEMYGLHKSFPGVKALDDVNFKLKKKSIHALMGENGAGKSTLMKCLFGVFTMDAGRIVYNGEEVKINSAKQALDYGISMVHQELNQVQSTRIMDNIWLGRFPMKGVFIDENKMFDDTLAIFKSLDIDLDPKTKVKDLPVSQRQMVEIAKAVSYDSKIVVLDEPTSSLTEKEVDHLFRIMRNLRDKGVGIVYISHKMAEIKRISDQVTIMRDGKWVATLETEEVTTDGIIKLMVGRDLTNRFPEKNNIPSDVILEIKNLTGTYQPGVKDISFNLHKGEILGVAGLDGSGRTELVETVFGIRHKISGDIIYKGEYITNKNAHEAIKNGFALITEERRVTGIFKVKDISFNTMIANIDNFVKRFFLNRKEIVNSTQKMINSLAIKTPSQKTPISSLSGGNQQKVIIGRWLLTNPHVLLMDEPTRGIDVGAKYEIYQLMLDLANEGKGVVMVSSEMPELLGITDRILVMSNGRLAGIVNTKETNQEEVLRLAAKYI